MAVRRETVRLELQDSGFSTQMLRNALATTTLERALKSLDGTNVRIDQRIDSNTRQLDTLSQSATRGTSSINQLTGRLEALAKAALVLGPSLIPIGAVGIPAITGLASSLGFAAIGMGSLVAASQGVGDALKTVAAADLEPTVENLQKASAAMSKLGPEAQAFVSRFQELRPVLGELRDSAAAGWFPGLTDSLDSLDRVAPRLASLLEAIGTTGGNLVAQGAEALAGPEWEDFLTFVETEGPEALADLGYSVGNVTKGLAELWMAFSPLNNDFSDFLLGASRGFEAWADGLAETEGFQEFVEYIRSEGPQVGRTLGSIAEAVVSIIKAASPLGGPVLAAFEVIADTLKVIADSPVGTKIFAMAAAFVVLNKALALTAGLLARTGFSGAAGAVRNAGPAGGGGGGAGGAGVLPIAQRAQAASGAFRQLRTDVRSMSTAYAGMNRAQSTATSLLSNTTAAATRTRATLAATGSTAVKTGAGIGAFAVATGALGQGLGLQNTAMLGLVGTMAGPWGAAVGAGIGLVADITAANRRWEESLRQINTALESGDSTQIAEANALLKQRLDYLRDLRDVTGVGDAIGDFLGTKAGYDMPEASDFEELQVGVRNLSPGLRDIAFEFGSTATKAQIAAGNIQDLRQELIGLNYVLTKQGQWGAYQAAIDDAAASIKENGRTLDQHTAKGRANAAAIRNIAASAVEYSNNLKGADRVAFLARARAAIRDAAKQAGGMTGETRALLRELRTLAGMSVKPEIDLKGDAATLSKMRAIRQEAQSVAGEYRLNFIVTQTNRINKPPAPQLGQNYTGGYTGPGGKYEPAGVVHRDEVVIPKELVKRDRNMLLSRYGHLPGMDQLHTGGLAGYASGGRVGSLPFADLPAYNLTTLHLGALNKVLAASTKALEREKTQRDAVVDKMKSLKGDVAGKFRSDLFGESNPWNSSDTGYARAMSLLQNDTANAKGFKADVAALKRKGLNGAALADLLTNGDATLVDSFANQSKAALARYERAYNARASVTASAGASAASAAYGRELAKQTAEMRAVAVRVARVEAAIKAEHKEDRRSSKRGAGSGARNRKRG